MSDVTVHIDETLDASSFHALQDDLSRMEGVHHIHTTGAQPHLMVVSYDQQSMTSMAILNEFSAHGLHAELIGL